MKPETVTTFTAFRDARLIFVRGTVNTECDEICTANLLFKFLLSETARLKEKQKQKVRTRRFLSIKDKGTAYYSNLT